eukprot:TRINITY_DN13162_c0_g1_i1.p1 TRINITY_DN13162_c0_g1~~TRINITY_DN13162_c0_g1_i1.p1  ORF type:complete len:108 (+),score=22.34 TRINITY_DN13162_c0_g1_i1:35-325(+)
MGEKQGRTVVVIGGGIAGVSTCFLPLQTLLLLFAIAKTIKSHLHRTKRRSGIRDQQQKWCLNLPFFDLSLVKSLRLLNNLQFPQNCNLKQIEGIGP